MNFKHGDAAALAAPVDPREAALARRKTLAVLLLVAAGVLLVAAKGFGRAYPHWGFGLLAAMAEAALVGGLADWFAVVALFRHPLGQRWIPHTAIIPAKKDAIGASLADFICDHFLGRQQVIDKLDEFDVARTLAGKLADEATARKVGAVVTRALPRLLGAINSRQLHAFITSMTRERLARVDLSRVAAFGLEQLTAGGRHHELVDAALAYVGEALRSEQTRAEISARVSNELWAFLRYAKLDGVVADKVADKLIAGMASLVTEMSEDRGHEMRVRIAQRLEALVAKLRDDPALRARIDGFRDELLAQEVLSEYLRGLWNDVVAWVGRDVEREDSVIALRIAQGTREVGARLLEDAAMREWINGGVKDTLEPLIDQYRDRIRAFIVERVRRWSADELTRELELGIGSDLQYIRYNGTAVGALVGGLIFVAGQAAVAFAR